ncbi:MGMT family protein [Humibacter ginsenosidimutans]|uniref:MGMT family protein n=1 Tax=Humibacter ginsenosidimutans TaxID=2599293 RepID=A0A5B8M5W2_9MICO|nr:MGMT family protein [Humibacter ginsenosidimutans]QDZ14860.1 MGMT family protein [Humibacter ginsenosidimutans]
MPGGRRPGPSEGFVEAVLEVVADIPSGHVMTYGQVAAVLGSRGARVVGQVMARYGDDVPWWRVIRASGAPPACHEGRALEHYLDEGTPLRGMSAERASREDAATEYRIDLTAARWSPELA